MKNQILNKVHFLVFRLNFIQVLNLINFVDSAIPRETMEATLFTFSFISSRIDLITKLKLAPMNRKLNSEQVKFIF